MPRVTVWKSRAVSGPAITRDFCTIVSAITSHRLDWITATCECALQYADVQYGCPLQALMNRIILIRNVITASIAVIFKYITVEV